MKDQAESLRNKYKNMHTTKQAKVIAVVSGKGGVGKSNFSLNFALGLSQKGNNVLLFDLDIGMGNIDILMGVSPKFTIVNMFQQNMSLRDIIEQGPENISYIAAGSGFSHLFQLDLDKTQFLIQQLELLINDYDYVIFDMGAGATEEMLHIAISVDELFVVTTPEPTSITDSYAMMKYFLLKNDTIPVYVLMNQVELKNEGQSTYQRLRQVVQQFLNKEIKLLGELPRDRAVSKAVSRQMPFLLDDPKSQVSRAMSRIVNEYVEENIGKSLKAPSTSFISKLRRYIFER